MSTKKSALIDSTKKVSKWFEIDLSIKLFGVEVFHWHFPPKNEEPSDDLL